MAVFSAGTGISAQYIINNAQAKLSALRNALEACENMHQWLAGVALADLEAAPLSFTASDAQAILTALADADALYQIYLSGQAPATYPQVTGTPYPYGASQRAVIGPLS